MNVRWVTPPMEGAGNTLGYATMIRELQASMLRQGLTLDDESELALHLMPPPWYTKIPGTRSVLFTMFECARIPEPLRPNLADADLIVVPCAWNVPIFQQYTDAPVVVCPLGTDPTRFPFVPRRWAPGEPFRWLHVGAPTGRKGADVLEECWNRWWSTRTDAHLTLKTTIGEASNIPVVTAMLLRDGWSQPQSLVFTLGNRTLDLRRLPVEDLAKLYQSHHAFAFPTGGEGWGLVLQEAMCTGLPALCTDVGGHLEFTTAETVTYLPSTNRVSQLEAVGYDAPMDVDSAWVEPVDLSAAMDACMRDYPAAVQRARWGARQAAAFTWQRAAKRMLQILAEFQSSRTASAA